MERKRTETHIGNLKLGILGLVLNLCHNNEVIHPCAGGRDGQCVYVADFSLPICFWIPLTLAHLHIPEVLISMCAWTRTKSVLCDEVM